MRWARVCALLLVAGLIAGCAGARLAPPAAPDAVDATLTVERKKVGADEPIVAVLTTRAAPGFALKASPPGAEGLEAVLVSEDERTEGSHTVVRRRYRLRGDPGSYLVVVPPLQVTGPEGALEALQLSPVAVDLGVDGPHSDLQDLAAVERPDGSPMALWLGLALALALAAAIWWLLRRDDQSVLEELPLLPPHDEALKAWESAISAADLDDHARALRLSAIFRRYLERRYGWGATRLTTREIRVRLVDQSGVTATLTDRAGRLLLATDLLKFARQGGGEAYFASLDDDFRTFLYATRQLEEPLAAAAGA